MMLVATNIAVFYLYASQCHLVPGTGRTILESFRDFNILTDFVTPNIQYITCYMICTWCKFLMYLNQH